jgi:hypothetical protein
MDEQIFAIGLGGGIQKVVVRKRKKDLKFRMLSIPTILGSFFTGFGLIFAATPGLVNKIGGVFLLDGPEVRLLIRLVGMRDLSLGLGMLASRANPSNVQLCRRVMAFNTATDMVLLGFFLPRSTIKLKVLVALLASALVTLLAVFSPAPQNQPAEA